MVKYFTQVDTFEGFAPADLPIATAPATTIGLVDNRLAELNLCGQDGLEVFENKLQLSNSQMNEVEIHPIVGKCPLGIHCCGPRDINSKKKKDSLKLDLNILSNEPILSDATMNTQPSGSGVNDTVTTGDEGHGEWRSSEDQYFAEYASDNYQYLRDLEVTETSGLKSWS